jgi:heat shock protein HspQ
VDDKVPESRYAIGDFVRCRYTFYQFYYPHYAEDFDDEPPYYGIVVDVDVAQYEDWPGEVVYVVFCTDRMYRFFVEEELTKLS